MKNSLETIKNWNIAVGKQMGRKSHIKVSKFFGNQILHL